ncbi:SIMPL domain-containing protein [Salinirubrum litoreum]|uniref:SIMPL domain-containing protein n=1 Tax=Salinirubrum litoreum TaxID=1126234 RepID=A0ABD5R634_9EURY|nr:SIMPL domain-containing protein [Salinirubrum litoreum]
MRRALLAVALAGLLLLAGCTAPLQTNASSTDGDTGPTLSASGTGQISAEADLAVVSVAVTARADSADDARGQVADGVASVRQALADAGIPEDAVTTAYFSVRPEYDDEDRIPDSYRATHALRIETDPARAGEVVDLAVGNGATEVNGVQFTLTDETRDELRSEALAQAVDRARADADAVAGAADLQITGVESISVGNSYSPGPFYAETAADRAGGATSFAPGPVTVSASVSITYTVE